MQALRSILAQGSAGPDPNEERHRHHRHQLAWAWATLAVACLGPLAATWWLRTRRGLVLGGRARLAVQLASTLLGVEAGARLLLCCYSIIFRLTIFDEAWMRTIWTLRSHIEQGVEFTHDPSCGWVLTPSLHDARPMLDAVVNTNTQGFRRSHDVPLSPAKGTTRIVALGNSYTYGSEESDDETWPAQLERIHPGCEVLNLGVPGYGHDQVLLRWRALGVQLHPQVVVVGFMAGDSPRNLMGFTFAAKPWLAQSPDGSLKPAGQPVPPPEEVLRRDAWRLKTFDLLEMLRDRSKVDGQGDDGTVRPALPHTARILAQLFTEIRASGAAPVPPSFPSITMKSGVMPVSSIALQIAMNSHE